MNGLRSGLGSGQGCAFMVSRLEGFRSVVGAARPLDVFISAWDLGVL